MSESDPPSSDPFVGTVVGRHLLVRLLGEGGMGVVYEGTHQDLGRRAAIKTLHERYARSAEMRQRFLREGQAASRVQHPNVVNIYDVGIDGSHPYLVMELLQGENLGRFLAREGVLSAERTADLLLPVVAAVTAAHDLGVVHRDLKPENIFLSGDRNTIKPKVLDFGISKIVEREEAQPLTSTGALLGTPQYMSPEQARGAKHLDHRSDQYSLGVILYQCTTARRPVEEPSLYALIQRIVFGEFLAPSLLNPDLPRAFEAVILRAMARDPGERFPTTRALGRALLGFASERVRVQYAEELSVDLHSATAVDPVAPTGEPGQLGTTLGESVLRRDLSGGPRPIWRRFGLGALPAAALLALLAWRAVSSRSQIVPLPPKTAAAAPVMHRIRDLPVPESKSPEAREAYRRGLEAYSRGFNSRVLFHEALARDPSMISATVRILVHSTWNWDALTPAVKELYARALAAEGNLPDRDRDILHALDPIIRSNPADPRALRRKLEPLFDKYPGDAEIAMLYAANVDSTESPAEILNAFDRAQQLDDSLADAFAIKLETCAYFGDFACVKKMDTFCAERFATSGSCLWFRSEWREHTGQCDEMERLARSIIAADATMEYGYRGLASALASLSKPVAAVEQVLKERWARVDPATRSQVQSSDQGRLAALTGDFDEVLNQAAKLEETVATSRDQAAHGLSAYLRIQAEREVGMGEKAVLAAKAFLDQRDGWDPVSTGEDNALAADVTPVALRVLAENEALERPELERQRSEWAKDWEHRFTGLGRSFLWLYGWTSTVINAEGAHTALSHRDEYGAIVPYRPRSMTELYEGVTYALAGKLDEAVERLSAATKTCRALQFPFEHTHAHDWLGRELERKGDSTGACRAYSVVAARWGHARPRSITADHARERRRALHCEAR